MLRLANRVEVATARRLGWSAGSVLTRTDVAVLDVVGVRSGSRRSAIVAVIVLGNSYLITGGAAGRKAVPDWVRNLQASPTVTVTFRKQVVLCSAREPVGPERDDCRATLVERWPRTEVFERRSKRSLPIFVLEPATTS